MSRTHRIDVDWQFERFSLDISFSNRNVRTTEQVADVLTKGAFTTILLKSLVLLFDIHYHSIGMLTAAFQNHLVLQFLSNTLL